MPDDLSIQQMRSGLLSRREELLAELKEVDDGLRSIANLVSVYSRLTGQSTPEDLATVPPGLTPDSEEKPLTAIVLDTVLSKGDSATFDPVGLTPEVMYKFGLELSQNQISVALRNLEKSNKIKLIRQGGPRRPAVYANLGYVEQASLSSIATARFRHLPDDEEGGGGDADT